MNRFIRKELIEKGWSGDKKYCVTDDFNEKFLLRISPIEQYERINLGSGLFRYALVCNGGILLVDGKEDGEWYKDSLKLISLYLQRVTRNSKIFSPKIPQLLSKAILQQKRGKHREFYCLMPHLL